MISFYFLCWIKYSTNIHCCQQVFVMCPEMPSALKTLGFLHPLGGGESDGVVRYALDTASEGTRPTENTSAQERSEAMV
jgi:hypothetical protein